MSKHQTSKHKTKSSKLAPNSDHREYVKRIAEDLIESLRPDSDDVTIMVKFKTRVDSMRAKGVNIKYEDIFQYQDPQYHNTPMHYALMHGFKSLADWMWSIAGGAIGSGANLPNHKGITASDLYDHTPSLRSACEAEAKELNHKLSSGRKITLDDFETLQNMFGWKVLHENILSYLDQSGQSFFHNVIMSDSAELVALAEKYEARDIKNKKGQSVGEFINKRSIRISECKEIFNHWVKDISLLTREKIEECKQKYGTIYTNKYIINAKSPEGKTLLDVALVQKDLKALEVLNECGYFHSILLDQSGVVSEFLGHLKQTLLDLRANLLFYNAEIKNLPDVISAIKDVHKYRETSPHWFKHKTELKEIEAFWNTVVRDDLVAAKAKAIPTSLGMATEEASIKHETSSTAASSLQEQSKKPVRHNSKTLSIKMENHENNSEDTIPLGVNKADAETLCREVIKYIREKRSIYNLSEGGYSVETIKYALNMRIKYLATEEPMNVLDNTIMYSRATSASYYIRHGADPDSPSVGDISARDYQGIVVRALGKFRDKGLTQEEIEGQKSQCISLESTINVVKRMCKYHESFKSILNKEIMYIRACQDLHNKIVDKMNRDGVFTVQTNSYGPEVEQYVLNTPLKIHGRGDARTVLDYVMANRSVALARIFVEKGAKTDAKNKWGVSPDDYIECVSASLEKCDTLEGKEDLKLLCTTSQLASAIWVANKVSERIPDFPQLVDDKVHEVEQAWTQAMGEVHDIF